MRATVLALVVFGAAITFGCSGGSGNSMMATSPTMPTSQTPASTAGIAGTWVGQASDSSGTVMGAGMSQAMMANMTWQITQSGNTFTGTMQFPGYTGHGTMTVTGTINGNTATFTMTMPGGGMMGGGTCTVTATGTFSLDDMFTQMHGTYSGGSAMCGGPFDHGQLSMMRR